METSKASWLTLTTGLLAGLFYGYACSVMPGLARVDDRAFVSVMQQINLVILNPAFLATFLGAPGLAVVALIMSRRRRGSMLAIGPAVVLHLVALGVTSFANVPLNDALAATRDPQAARVQFEAAWVAWNVVRAGLLTVAFGCLVAALARR